MGLTEFVVGLDETLDILVIALLADVEEVVGEWELVVGGGGGWCVGGFVGDGYIIGIDVRERNERLLGVFTRRNDSA